MLNRFITGLLVVFLIALAAFPALFLGMLVCQTGGDRTGGAVFRALLTAELVVVATITLLLVGCLSFQSLASHHSTDDREDHRD